MRHLGLALVVGAKVDARGLVCAEVDRQRHHHQLDPHLVAVLVGDVVHDRVQRLAEGTLEVGEHHQRDLARHLHGRHVGRRGLVLRIAAPHHRHDRHGQGHGRPQRPMRLGLGSGRLTREQQRGHGSHQDPAVDGRAPGAERADHERHEPDEHEAAERGHAAEQGEPAQVLAGRRPGGEQEQAEEGSQAQGRHRNAERVAVGRAPHLGAARSDSAEGGARSLLVVHEQRRARHDGDEQCPAEQDGQVKGSHGARSAALGANLKGCARVL
jgi:hypothetical protein